MSRQLALDPQGESWHALMSTQGLAGGWPLYPISQEHEKWVDGGKESSQVAKLPHGSPEHAFTSENHEKMIRNKYV